jgi:hypothetical protein
MPDTYASNVVSLIHFNGTNGSTTIPDATGNIITLNGNTNLNTSVYKLGSASGYFDGNGDFITFTDTITGRLALGTNDFTIEAFVYPTSTDSSDRCIWGTLSTNYYGIYQYGANFYWYEAGSRYCATANITANTWYHVALVKSGTTIDVFLDGVKSSTSRTFSTSIAVNTYYLGANGGAHPFIGYIDEFRWSNRIARYSSNFTSPSAEFEYDIVYELLDEPDISFSLFDDYPETNIVELDEVQSVSYWDGGTFSISGTVTYNNSPSSRIVRLHTLKDGRLIKQVWTNSVDGSYSFTGLKNQSYYVWSEDYLQVFDPVSHIAVVDI